MRMVSMASFSTSLVREKIVVVMQDKSPETAKPVVIRSNRVHLRLTRNKITENIVVRAQNMPDTLRMAGVLMDEYYRKGPFQGKDITWENFWWETVSDYGRVYNGNQNWVAVYIDGESVFETTSSPFVDVVEQCALVTLDNYDKSMEVAEMALDKLGKTAQIEHSANVATVLKDNGTSTRVGVMQRSADSSKTFHFTAEGGRTRRGRISRCLFASASFLENIDLEIFIRNTERQIEKGELGIHAEKAVKCQAAVRRRTDLLRYINSFEKDYTVQYRPEKPDFFKDV